MFGPDWPPELWHQVWGRNSAPGLIPREDHAIGKRPGLDQVQDHPVVQGSEERATAAYQRWMRNDHVLVDQASPPRRPGEGGSCYVHLNAVLRPSPGDLGHRVAGHHA